MKIEVMIYVYIAICVSMIAYNIIYVFVLRYRAKSLVTVSKVMEDEIFCQVEKIKQGEDVDEKHMKYLRKELDKTSGITAFDKALSGAFLKEPDGVERYLMAVYPVFEYLTNRYISKDTLKIAYFPYILHKYNILKHGNIHALQDILLELLRSVNVYCRENTLKTIYGTGNHELVIMALKIIDKNLSFHHPKLICDGLMFYSGDKEELCQGIWENMTEFSIQMRVNLLNYFRFAGVRCDEKMLSLLKGEKEDPEIHFSAIRYFEKFPSDEAKPILYDMAENKEGRTWEYQAIATSALKSYPGDITFRILVKNLSSSNWHVRQNGAISCEKLGYTYQDLINVFDGDDRYAREIMRYRLDRRKAEDKVVKA